MRITILLLMFGIMESAAGAESITTLLHSGSAAAKKDLVFIGDGFRAGADQDAFNDIVNDLVSGMFSEGPLWESMNAFNIHRVNVESADSGVTQIDANGNVTASRNTALDWRFSGSDDRCYNEPGPNSVANINEIVSRLVPEADLFFIVLQETSGGGCKRGNTLAITTGEPWTTGTHEMGHLVAGLGDEACRPGTHAGGEPSEVNLTTKTVREELKWRQFVSPLTPLPTGVSDNPKSFNCSGWTAGTKPEDWSAIHDAGLFEGGQYQAAGIYRPALACRMHRADSGTFCPVCYDMMKLSLDAFHEHTFRRSYAGDFTGDGLDDVVIHNANSLALHQSAGADVEPLWIATGAIAVWGDLAAGDSFHVADFDDDGRDDLYVVNLTDWGTPYLGMFRSTGTGFECVRRFDGALPGWGDMGSGDQFLVADFDGDGREDLYAFNGSDWSIGYLGMLRSTGTDLSFVERYDETLPGWGQMAPHDRFLVADFDGDQKDDLYIFNGEDWTIGYLQLLGSNGSALNHVHRYVKELPGWQDMAPHDQFHVADFDGDGRDDLYAFNGIDWSTEYLHMLRSTGTELSSTQQFDGALPGWKLAPHDQLFVADVNGDGSDDLYIYNGQDWSLPYLATIRSTGTSLDGEWQDSQIGSWVLSGKDRFLVANFNGAGGDDLMVRNDDWFGLLRSHSTSVQLTALYPKWIHRYRYHNRGYW